MSLSGCDYMGTCSAIHGVVGFMYSISVIGCKGAVSLAGVAGLGVDAVSG